MDDIELAYEVTGTEPMMGKMHAAVKSSIELADHFETPMPATSPWPTSSANVIDTAVDSGNPEMIHRASCVPMPTLHKILTSLGLNPEGRKNLACWTARMTTRTGDAWRLWEQRPRACTPRRCEQLPPRKPRGVFERDLVREEHLARAAD